MNLQELDLYLRKENDYELSGDIHWRYVDSSKFAAIVPNTLKGYKNMASIPPDLLVSHIFSADGILAFKQDRYHDVENHTHDWLELAYQYSGSATLLISGQTVHLSCGQCVLINYNTPHSCDACGSDDILVNLLISRHYLDVNFFNRFSDGNPLSQYLMDSLVSQNQEQGFIYFPSENSRRLPIFLKEFLCEYYDKTPRFHDILDSLTTLIFLELSEIYTDQAKSTKDNAMMLSILHYIEDHTNDCTLEDIASIFHRNPNYLSGYIKKHTGKTFKQLLLQQRLEYASRLLLNSELPITEIAQQTGYENVTFFYRKFKEYFGCLPGEFRTKKESLLSEPPATDNSSL